MKHLLLGLLVLLELGAITPTETTTCSTSAECNDGNVCTTDQCKGGTCVHENNTYSTSCYDGPSGTIGVGACRAGTKTCSGGKLGPCSGQVVPTAEACDGNGVDEDCDGQANEEGATGCATLYRDVDLDGFGTSTSKCLCEKVKPFGATKSGDCNDRDPKIGPHMSEVCTDGVDQNCDGHADCADPSCGQNPFCQGSCTIAVSPVAVASSATAPVRTTVTLTASPSTFTFTSLPKIWLSSPDVRLLSPRLLGKNVASAVLEVKAGATKGGFGLQVTPCTGTVLTIQ